MAWDTLKKDYVNGVYKSIYVFWGDEKYGIEEYVRRFRDALVEPKYKMFNYVVIEGGDIERNIIQNCSTLPVFSNHKMVVVRNSKLFARKNKKGETEEENDSKKDNKSRDELIDFCKNIPEGVHLFFVEEEVNKTLTMYKRLNTQGAFMQEFTHMTQSDLDKWLTREFKNRGISVTSSDMSYFINYVGISMYDLENEMMKLASYIGYGGEFKKEYVDLLCAPSLQNKVFDMLDCISNQKAESAYKLLKDMLILKEPIQKIMVLVARQFRIMYLVKQLKESGRSNAEMASTLKLQPFVVSKTLGQIVRYTSNDLKNAINDILDIDIKSKTGKIDAVLGLETFIGKYSQI